MGKLKALSMVKHLIDAMQHEYEEEAECMEALLEEREEALENQRQCDETFKQHGAALCIYNELEDDQVFAEKAADCHKKHSLFRKSLRGK